MKNFNVPANEEISTANQAILANLTKALGFRPNLYAYMAKNDTALADYLALQNRKSTLKAKEKEVINLVVSQVNSCAYCLAAHTAIAKMHGFSDREILEIRSGAASFDPKLDALAAFVKDTTINRGHPQAASVDALLNAGYTESNLIDIVIMIGDKIITNFLHGISQVPVDFPAAPKLDNLNA